MARIDLFRAGWPCLDTRPPCVRQPRPCRRRMGPSAAGCGSHSMAIDRPTVSLDEGRRMIADAITHLADLPAEQHVVDRGAGRDWQDHDRRAHGGGMRQRASQRVLYVGPRREFFADVQALAARPAWWTAWQPRHGGEGRDRLWCYLSLARSDQYLDDARLCGQDLSAVIHASAAGATGMKAAATTPRSARLAPIVFCPIRAYCARSSTDGADGADYWRRATHPRVSPPLADSSISHRPARHCRPQAAAILRRLYTLATVPNITWSGAELLDALGGATAVAQACARFRQDVSFAAYEPELRGPNDAEDVPYFHLPQTMALLGREAERTQQSLPSISRVRVDASGLTLLLRRAPRQLPPHVIWLTPPPTRHCTRNAVGRPVTVVPAPGCVARAGYGRSGAGLK